MYEFTGKVKSVGEVQTFASGFTKRELVVEEERKGNRPNVVAFTFKKDNAAKLDGVKPGMRVKVGFAVDGREWTDPKTGKVRFLFISAQLAYGIQIPMVPSLSNMKMTNYTASSAYSVSLHK